MLRRQARQGMTSPEDLSDIFMTALIAAPRPPGLRPGRPSLP
jgi:hypothetical protein